MLHDSVIPPVLPAPVPRRGPLPFFEFFRVARDNMIATYPAEAYESEILDRKIFGKHRLLVSQPAAIKHVLLDNAANYQKTEIVRRLLEPGLGRGLLTSEGETWRRHRRTMAPSFDHRSIAAYTPIMSAATGELLADWSRLAPDVPLDISTEMMRLALHIISRTMFSADSETMCAIMERGAEHYQTQMRPNIMDFLGLPAWLAALPRKQVVDRTLGEFDAEIDRLIRLREHPSGGGRTDLLARLIAARDAETGSGMTPQDVRDHVITIFMAGHETTAMTMTWIWYLLSQHPREEAALHAELAAELGGRVPTEDDVGKLVYTRMVIEESMRLYPPAHTISRAALADDTVAGQFVPKGSTVLISPWVLHRHRLLWKHPEAFIPERFSPEQSAARPRFSYLPFGGGRRICIGAAFAMTEATVLLATIAQRYRLRLVPGHPVEPRGLITLRARHGMQMVPEPR